jgi:peptidoglycan-associated lipoprotein
MRFRLILWILIPVLAACSADKKAMKAFRLGKYQNTIETYKKTLAKNPNDARANYYVAESYRLSNRIKEAESYYAKAGGRGVDKDSVRFYYAQSLKANSKYDEAKKQLEEIVQTTSNNAMKDIANTAINGIEYLVNLNEKKNYYRVKNLETLNTPASEYAPVFLNNELYFTSSRGNGKIYEATGTPFTNIYKVASRGANVDVATLAPLPEGINSPNINDGTLTFSPDGKIMVFAKGNTGRRKGFNSTEDVDLYISRFRNGSWTEPVPLNINDPNAWDSCPTFSPDGRTLYFASNRKGRGKDNRGYGFTWSLLESPQSRTRDQYSGQ